MITGAGIWIASAAVTVMRGGLKPNVIPDAANIVIDVRTEEVRPDE